MIDFILLTYWQKYLDALKLTEHMQVEIIVALIIAELNNHDHIIATLYFQIPKSEKLLREGQGVERFITIYKRYIQL